MTQEQTQKHWEKVIEDINSSPELLADKEYRLRNFYFVTNKDGQKVLFKPNRAQEDYLKNRKYKNVILKSRQLGMTTFITLDHFDSMLFEPNVETLSIAHTKEEMIKIFDKKVRYAFSNFPDELKEMWAGFENSAARLKVKFNDGSMSGFTVALSGIGGTFQYVHVSEFAKLFSAFPDRAERITQETFPAVPFHGMIELESTAEGANGPFYDIWCDALKNKASNKGNLEKVQFYPHFYNWTYDDSEIEKITDKDIIDVYDMEKSREIDWIGYQKMHDLSDVEMTYYYNKWVYLGKDKGIDELNSQYPTVWEEAFISTGKPYFNARRVSELMGASELPTCYDVIGEEIVEVGNGSLQVLKRPEKDEFYVIGGDTSEGKSDGDFSVLVVVNAKTKEPVALYRDRVEPLEFSTIAYRVGRWYNNALLAIEVNKDGLWVNDNLQRSGYPNLYFREQIDDITKNMQKYFGWRTDMKSRDTMLTELKTQFLKVDIKFKDILMEMMSFIRNKRGKPEAVSGHHDDTIIATSIAMEVAKQRFHSGFFIDTSESNKTMLEVLFGE